MASTTTVMWDLTTDLSTNSTTESDTEDEVDLNIGGIVFAFFCVCAFCVFIMMVQRCMKENNGFCNCFCECLNEILSAVGRCFSRLREGARDLSNSCESVRCQEIRTSVSTNCYRMTSCLRHSQSEDSAENNASTSTQTPAPELSSRSTNTELSDIQTELGLSVIQLPEAHASNDSSVPPPSYESVMRGGGAYRDVSLTGVVLTDPPPSYEEVV